MKKKTPILDLYYEWGKTGKITHDPVRAMIPNGLCSTAVARYQVFELFDPNDEIYERSEGYWGYDGCETPADALTGYQKCIEFTPFRQTIVLFCAAMNNEL